MSGHSKWSTIKRQKAVTDARRASVFTKHARLIAVAARAGGPDPSGNFRLRLAIEKARSANMPNDNIDRAVKSGAGGPRGEQTKEVTYEGFGPTGVAILVQAVTDNTNRTAAEVRATLQKHGGRLGGQNSVAWMFQLRSVIRIPTVQITGQTVSEVELGAIDAGVDDVKTVDQALVLVMAPEKLKSVESWLAQQRLDRYTAEVELIPQTTSTIDQAARPQLYQLLEALDELPDVIGVFSNDE